MTATTGLPLCVSDTDGDIWSLHADGLYHVIDEFYAPSSYDRLEADFGPLEVLQYSERIARTSTETIITDPNTGASKGHKDVQIGDVDPLALIELGKVAEYGSRKYEQYNYIKGMPYSWSYNAMQRHLMAYWANEDRDREDHGGSGLPHLAHAAWHCLALLSYYLRETGTDDRPHTALQPAPVDPMDLAGPSNGHGSTMIAKADTTGKESDV